jgi:hypothetical protein
MSDWFANGGNGSQVDAGAMLDSEAMKRLAGMVNAGALVSLSLTSDGGALGVTVTVDGRYRREYFRDPDELDRWTEEAMAPVIQACEDRSASRAQAPRQRGTRAR